MHNLPNINLLGLNCKNYTNEDSKLSKTEIKELLKQTSGLEVSQTADNSVTPFIYKDFKFKNYYQTIAFINAIAWIIHQQDHHLQKVYEGYNRSYMGSASRYS